MSRYEFLQVRRHRHCQIDGLSMVPRLVMEGPLPASHQSLDVTTDEPSDEVSDEPLDERRPRNCRTRRRNDRRSGDRRSCSTSPKDFTVSRCSRPVTFLSFGVRRFSSWNSRADARSAMDRLNSSCHSPKETGLSPPEWSLPFADISKSTIAGR